ncbi:MAG: hypothetical protein QME59_08085 [Candidatus Hydrothermarchaeota archaeon]|nr:hypothetical protein [Candidatus Hydrothermarchaeota archaeon]
MEENAETEKTERIEGLSTISQHIVGISMVCAPFIMICSLLIRNATLFMIGTGLFVGSFIILAINLVQLWLRRRFTMKEKRRLKNV